MSRKPVDPVRVEIRSESNVTRVVVEASRMARDLGFGSLGRNQIATAVSELSRNILKYAGRGEVLLEPVGERSRVGLKLVASDQGPGIENLSKALQDHYSTGGTLGLGLPGVRRLMDDFEIDTAPDCGTRVTAVKWHIPARA